LEHFSFFICIDVDVGDGVVDVDDVGPSADEVDVGDGVGDVAGVGPGADKVDVDDVGPSADNMDVDDVGVCIGGNLEEEAVVVLEVVVLRLFLGW